MDIPNQAKVNQNLAIAGLVLGTLSLIFFFIYRGLFSLALATAGTICGILALQKSKKVNNSSQIDIAGLVISIVGMIISVGVYFWMPSVTNIFKKQIENKIKIEIKENYSDTKKEVNVLIDSVYHEKKIDEKIKLAEKTLKEELNELDSLLNEKKIDEIGEKAGKAVEGIIIDILNKIEVEIDSTNIKIDIDYGD